MEFIISRNYPLPDTPSEFGKEVEFNLWSRKHWPYYHLQTGDVIYWYETPRGRIAWKTRTLKAERLAYQTTAQLRRWLRSNFGPYDETESYVVNAPEHGFCLAFKSKALRRLNIRKPSRIRFPRLGWCSAEEEIGRNWLSQIQHAKGEKTSGTRQRDRSFSEGGTREITTELRERSDRLRRQALREYGHRCKVCGFHFGEFYGELGEGYIEVHHLFPLSKSTGKRKTRIEDVTVVCANCHRVLHLNGSRPLPLLRLKQAIEKQKQRNDRKHR
jgi:5-methylcytosine-specific restriction endonuclease McrA